MLQLATISIANIQLIDDILLKKVYINNSYFSEIYNTLTKLEIWAKGGGSSS